MKKKISYLLFSSILIISLVFIGNSVSAAGGACGASGQGKCQRSCDPNDDIIYPTTTLSQGQDTCAKDETCCVPTVCGRNSIGMGNCVSSGSCGTGEVGLNTSDCTPPKLCCTVPKGSEVSPGEEVNAPNDVTTPTSGAIQDQPTSVFPDDEPIITPSGTSGGLVPCDGFDCTICDIFTLIKNLINLFTELVFAFAGGFIVWGAIEIMVAGGDEKKVSSGRGRITVAIFGVVIALSAWMLIGTALQVFTGSSSYLPWNKIECSSKAIWKEPVITGSDSACFAKGGSCRNIKTLPCDGDVLPGLCKSSSDANYKCCIPKKITGATCTLPDYGCYLLKDASSFGDVTNGTGCTDGKVCVKLKKEIKDLQS